MQSVYKKVWDIISLSIQVAKLSKIKLLNHYKENNENKNKNKI